MTSIEELNPTIKDITVDGTPVSADPLAPAIERIAAARSSAVTRRR